MKKVSAVEWLEDNYLLIKKNKNAYFKYAKEMEKQQIENAYWDGGQDIPSTEKRCEEYYNEVFKQQ
jgi:hypothetical protein